MTIVVSTGDEPTLVQEMSVNEPEMGYIAEMISEPEKLDAYISGTSAKAKLIAEANADENPEFPVVRVEEGWSKNRRLYDAETLQRIAEQVNEMEPVAHLGHMREDEVATAFPDPQTTWLAAVTKIEPSRSKDRKGEPVAVFYAAGYNLPGAKVRTYLKSRAVRGVSWLGFGKEVPVPGKGVQIKDFRLLALDWARKNGEGMPNTSIVTIAREQMEGDMADKNLAAVTPEEFKKENPNGYALLVREAQEESLKLVAEMEEKVKTSEEQISLLDKLLATLKLDKSENVLQDAAALIEKIGAEARVVYEKLLEKELVKRVPDEKQRGLVQRLVFSAEMQTRIQDANEEEASKLVSEQVEKAFNDDDNVKFVVEQTAPPVVRRREEIQNGRTQDLGGYVVEETRKVS
jgi:hypothetical protein